jgi:hypothetical protein
MSDLRGPDQEEAGLLTKVAAMRVCTCDCYQKLAFPRCDWSLTWMDSMPIKYNRGCPAQTPTTTLLSSADSVSFTAYVKVFRFFEVKFDPPLGVHPHGT